MFVHSWLISRRSFVLFFSLFGSNPLNCPIIILTEPSLDYCVMWTQLGAKFRSPYSAIFPIKCLILAVKNLLSLLHKFRCPFTVTLCVSSESYWILQINHIEFYKYMQYRYIFQAICVTFFEFVFFIRVSLMHYIFMLASCMKSVVH